MRRATQYDHRDYNKPLEVTPVCPSCNGKRGAAIYQDQIHKNMKKGGSCERD